MKLQISVKDSTVIEDQYQSTIFKRQKAYASIDGMEVRGMMIQIGKNDTPLKVGRYEVDTDRLITWKSAFGTSELSLSRVYANACHPVMVAGSTK